MTVVPYEVPRPARPSWIEVMDHGVELAEMIANTDFVPKGLRGNQPAIMAAILYGHEVGLEPMQSLAKIAVIDGKPTMAAETQRALIFAAGHELWIEESTTTRAVVAARRRDSKLTQRVTWTLDDAKRARLAGKQNWQGYPRQMLVARASAELARQVFPDVIGGIAATEEFVDEVEVQDGPTVEAEGEEQKAPTRRRRRTPAATAKLVEAPPLPEPEQPGPEDPPESPEESGPREPSDPPPSSPSAPDAAEPDLASEAQRRRVFAAYRDMGIEDRDERLTYAKRVIGREIASSTELTALEASVLMSALETDISARTERELEEVGAVEIEPPPLPGE